MTHVVRVVVWWLTRLVLPLRYDVRLHGEANLASLKRPILLLPNHPAYIDPVLFFSTFDRKLRPRIVFSEGNFSAFVVRLFARVFDAIPIPDLLTLSQQARFRSEEAIQNVIGALRRGENVALWPSGRAQRDGMERLGPASALTQILQAVPEASVVVVRTRGLWGSMFSYARTGRAPVLSRRVWQGVFLLIANLLVLTPRRRVDITIEPIDRSALPPLERDAVNRWFEERFNVEGPEAATYVPVHFLVGSRHYAFPAELTSGDTDVDLKQVPEEIRTEVIALLASRAVQTFDPMALRGATRLADLGFDSLQRMDLTLAVEQRFGGFSASSPETFGQLLAIAQHVAADVSDRPLPSKWFRIPEMVRTPEPLATNLPEAFVNRALTSPRDVAAADDLSGILTYEELLVGALLMARRFGRLPQRHVGLMLPASVAADIAALGLMLAGKVPVLLNWTTGPANLNHAVRLTGVTDVITSRALRDRLGLHIDHAQFVDLEDVRAQIGWFERARTLLKVRFAPGAVRDSIPKPPPDAWAVILFTSGSEKAPKGVPLTHGNILSNLIAVPTVLELTNKDVLVSFLPMFHAFGFAFASLFPLLCAVRVVHHPDPTDIAGLIRKIALYRPTVLIGMPSLVGQILSRGQASELESLTQIVVGAEKCPESLFELAARVVPRAVVLEAYGVTECSPGISSNSRTSNRRGTIGRPIPEVEVQIVDPETNEPLPPGQTGMLLVSGPNVFPGYLGEESDPFILRDGKRWYRTGDLGDLDPDGYLHLRGRLKRFLKSAGEMISLPALEEPLASRFPPDQDGPHVAVEGIDQGGQRRIVLFTTESIDLIAANELLANAGLRGVMRFDEVRRLPRIPLLGNGKVDYKQLKSLVADNFSHAG